MTSPVLRPLEPRDTGFLLDLYASTRTDELAPVPWSAEQKRRFLEQQFAAQDVAYRENYPQASFSVVLLDDQPIGRLYLTRLGDHELRIIDIALLPQHRNKGIGAVLVRRVIADAAAAGETVSLHVEQWNPAIRFYTRLGFRRAGENDVHVRMELAPPPTSG